MVLTIIIPVFNEKTSISKLLEKVSAADSAGYEKEIVVVDDCSSDGTSGLIESFALNENVIAIHLAERSGKTEAIKAGLKRASGDIILIQDADLEYSPDDYAGMLAPFNDTAVQAVYGSRFLNVSWPENMTLPNWIANKVFTTAINILYNSGITDEGTGYKVFRRSLLESISIDSSGFGFCPEVTSKLLKKGVKIIEVPISYTARNRNEGKKPVFMDGVNILWTIIKLRFKD